MMWIFFDRLWGRSAAEDMKTTFSSTLRLPRSTCAGTIFKRRAEKRLKASYHLRETINAHVDRVRSLADGVLFEFGPSRHRDLELRTRIPSVATATPNPLRHADCVAQIPAPGAWVRIA